MEVGDPSLDLTMFGQAQVAGGVERRIAKAPENVGQASRKMRGAGRVVIGRDDLTADGALALAADDQGHGLSLRRLRRQRR